jgi:N-acetylmuramoyl-L-alanine amidase
VTHGQEVTDTQPLRDRSRTVGIALAGAIAIIGIVVLGGLLSLLPRTGLHCSRPGARVMLDPGHGGDDPGAINDAAGLVERELVLDIARRTAARLEEAGYSVALTRDDNATGYANTPRGVMANLCHSFAYVSIHLNSFGEPEPNYAKTFWGIEEKDAAFASVMQAGLVSRLQPGTDLGDSGLEVLENGGLLTARMPAVLVEPVFLSNPEEAARLADPAGERREAIAAAVSDGVDAWLRSKGLGPFAEAGISGRAPGVGMTAQDSVLAPPRGSAVRALAPALRAGARRPEEVRAYVMEVYRLAPLVGIDPAIVVAQSAHETGWWQSPAWADDLNPAGIGITGPDVASPSWENGVAAARAHLVHLFLYAVGPIPPGHPLAPYIPLDPRYEAALAAGRAGSAGSLADLTGRWATDPDYAGRVARVGTRLFAEG